jgi:hypothetical protein
MMSYYPWNRFRAGKRLVFGICRACSPNRRAIFADAFALRGQHKSLLAFCLLAMLLLLAGCTPKPETVAPIVPALSASDMQSSGTTSVNFQLTEVAAQRGVRFRHTSSPRLPLTIVETMGSGCAFFDFDNDGWQDVFLVNAGDDFLLPKQRSGSKLFRNRGDGNFEDVTEASGIRIEGYAMGCCIGDYDNDGRDDLFVSGYGQNWLFHNEGQGKFREVTAAAGIPKRAGAWGMGCAFVDVNRDSKLDLYVANYVVYDPKIPLCRSANVMHGCTPNQYKTQRNELYIQQGGKFVDRAVELGADDPTGAGLGVVVFDFDNDGWMDIFVANDGTPNALLHNRNGRFENVGQVAGVAFGENGIMRAGMGTDAGDYTGDGQIDLIVTNFQHEPNSLYRNEGKGMFQDVSFPDGTGTPCLAFLAFGVVFVDLDGDGKLDLYVGNGHVYDNVHAFDDTAQFEQRDQVFRNVGGRFEEVLPESNAFPTAPSVARSVIAGDFNNDGVPDILINSQSRPVRLLENKLKQPGHWLGLKLLGARSNRSAIGARIELRGPEGVQVREVRSGGSYLGQPDLRALFRLNASTRRNALQLQIRWPNGITQRVPVPELDRYTTLREP